MSEVESAVKNIFDKMPVRINADAAEGLNAVIQYDLSGEGGGVHHSAFSDGKCTVCDGAHDAPNMTVSMAASDFVDMIEGRLDGMSAFMSGRLRISGDMGLAMKLQTLFRS